MALWSSEDLGSSIKETSTVPMFQHKELNSLTSSMEEVLRLVVAMEAPIADNTVGHHAIQEEATVDTSRSTVDMSVPF